MAETYGRINVFGELELNPISIVRGQQIILNPTVGEIVSNGFKRVVYDEKPDTTEYDDEGIDYYVKQYYEETDDTIYVKYEIIEQDDSEEQHPDDMVRKSINKNKTIFPFYEITNYL